MAAKQARRRYGRLKINRHGQIFHWTFETKFGDIDMGNFLRHIKNFSDDVIFVVKFFTHSHTLGTLSRKEVSYLFHSVFSGLKKLS
jgi:hypothetical protein